MPLPWKPDMFLCPLYPLLLSKCIIVRLHDQGTSTLYARSFLHWYRWTRQTTDNETRQWIHKEVLKVHVQTSITLNVRCFLMQIITSLYTSCVWRFSHSHVHKALANKIAIQTPQHLTYRPNFFLHSIIPKTLEMKKSVLTFSSRASWEW